MFARYPLYGKSIPSIRTFATSVPRPPSAPPAARGAGVFGACFVGAGDGVAGTGGARRGGAAVRAGMSRGVVWERGGGVAVGGTGRADGGVTAPIARGPGGAATRLTRYTGGRAVAAGPRVSTSATTSTA